MLASCEECCQRTAHGCHILLCLPQLRRASPFAHAAQLQWLRSGGVKALPSISTQRGPSDGPYSSPSQLGWPGLVGHQSSFFFSFAQSSFVPYSSQVLIPNPHQHLFSGNPACNNQPTHVFCLGDFMAP